MPLSSAARSCVVPRRRPVWAATSIPLAVTRRAPPWPSHIKSDRTFGTLHCGSAADYDRLDTTSSATVGARITTGSDSALPVWGMVLPGSGHRTAEMETASSEIWLVLGEVRPLFA